MLNLRTATGNKKDTALNNIIKLDKTHDIVYISAACIAYMRYGNCGPDQLFMDLKKYDLSTIITAVPIDKTVKYVTFQGSQNKVIEYETWFICRPKSKSIEEYKSICKSDEENIRRLKLSGGRMTLSEKDGIDIKFERNVLFDGISNSSIEIV